MPSGAPGGAIGQGSIFTLLDFESSISAAQQAAFPLSEELAGYRVEIETSDGQLFRALPLSKFLFALNVLMPSGIPVGEHALTVIQGGERRQSQRVKVVRASPGLFTSQQYGRQGLLGQDLMRPAAHGDRNTLWATGLGPIAGSDDLPPPVGDLPTELTVTIGGIEAEILYQGRAPCCAGLDQIDILIPEEAPLGCSVPVWVTAYGSLYSNVAAMAIAEPGRACWEVDGALNKPFIDAPTGRALFSRLTEREGDSVEVSSDGRAGFVGPVTEEPGQTPGNLINGRPGQSGHPIPPRGACALHEPVFSRSLLGSNSGRHRQSQGLCGD